MTLFQLVLTLRLMANNWAGADRTYSANPSKRVLAIRSIINEFQDAGESLLPEVLSQLTDLADTWEAADQHHMGRRGKRANELRLLLEEFDTH